MRHLKCMGTRISAHFLCLDGRVSGQSSERLLACHSDPCLHFWASALGLFPAGSPGEVEKTASALGGRRGLYRTREFCVAALFFLTEDGPESAGRWPFHVPSPHTAAGPDYPRQSPTGASQRGQEAEGRKSERNTVQSSVGEVCRLKYTHMRTHTYTRSSHQLEAAEL